MADLFDAGLAHVGLREHFTEETTTTRRCLTEGDYFLWVDADEKGQITGFTRYAGNRAAAILQAISNKLDIKIVSEHEPQYWGYATEQELKAACGAMAKEGKRHFYEEVIKFIQGEPHTIQPGTAEMTQANTAKELITEFPELSAEERWSDLIEAVETLYRVDHILSPGVSRDRTSGISSASFDRR